MKKQNTCYYAALFFLGCLLLAFTISCSDNLTESDETTENDENIFTGTWVKIWEGETYNYTPSGEEEADALVFDIGDSDFRAVFYLNSEQVGGFTGSYTVEEDEIIVTVQYLWNSNEEFWEVPEESTIYNFPFELEGNYLAVIGYDPDLTQIELTKTAFRNPLPLSIDWTGAEGNEGSVLYLNADGTFRYDDGGDSSLDGTWDCSDYLFRIVTVFDEEISRGYLYNYELYDETDLYIDGGGVIAGGYAKTHTLTVSMEDPDGTANNGVRVYIDLGNGEGSEYSDSALFSGGAAEIFFPAVKEKEYLFNAFIDEIENGYKDSNEFYYSLEWILIDEDTVVTIGAGDWDFPAP